MTITNQDIEKLTKKLSKIGLEDEKMVDDINSILDYINMLNEVDTTGVQPTVNVVEMDKKTKLRTDDLQEKDIKNTDLLACSPQKVIQNQIAVSNIMK